MPGFAPAINNEAGPISDLQDAYANVYNLDYAPIIMQPMLFSMVAPNRPVYYSLEYPTMNDLPQKSHIRSNKITNLCQIHYLLNKIQEEILHGELNLEHTPYYDLTQLTQFDFYHTDAEKYPHIKFSSEIPQQDKNFLANIKTSNSVFPENSPFICGCIRVSAKNKK